MAWQAIAAKAAVLSLIIQLCSWGGVAKADALSVQLPKPPVDYACPVCGMFVAKYPDWVATVRFNDGHADHFDGAKDMFKFLAAMEKYVRTHQPGEVSAIGVTEYYDLDLIDARQGVYVIGSNVLGPMGHEFIPFRNRADAEAFMTDHRGRRILSFDEITGELCRKLDQGKFE